MNKELTSGEVNSAIEDLIAAGILGRWWCEQCADWVPYRTHLAKTVLDEGGKPGQAYGERASRTLHNEWKEHVATTEPAP